MNCRFCQTQLKSPFLSLGCFPLANAFLKKEDLNKMEPRYPLDVYVCESCFLVQLEEFESAENIFSADYAYYSGYSDIWLKHCKAYAEKITKRLNLGQDSFVLEVGSNDGALLQYFKKKRIAVFGVDPAAGAAKVAIKKGIPTDIAFFNTDYAKKIAKNKKKADLIIGNNVLAHNPQLNDFVEALRIALKNEGVITMEFPHLLELIKNNEFDTIYHEHFSYFSFYVAFRLFASHNLVLFDVEQIPIHGGSLRIYAKHKNDKSKKTTQKVKDLLSKEKRAGLLKLNTYHAFKERVNQTKRDLLNFLIQEKNKSKKIVAYGAPAKGNTLLNFCEIRTDVVDYTVDRNPHKQNKYLPGTHIPIRHPDKIREDKPDYVLILAWNIKDEIMSQLSFIKKWGGKFIIPIPRLKVI